jgi:ABC-type Mn2+/Zn2+ transport system ATPase subunit
LVEASALAVGYGGAPVIHGVEFAVEPGQSVAVLGPNGGGKTTLLRALLGELQPLTGEARVDGRPAYVAQTERTRLDFPVTALEVTLMGTLAGGRWWLPARRSERAAAAAALERVGLTAAAGTLFGELSGGQRQRVLLARALVQDAHVLLLDEPLAGVDRPSAEAIEALLAQLRDEGRAVLVSTHDVEGARGFDRVLCLSGGQVAYGPPAETLRREVLEQTYGSEIVVLEDDGGKTRAVAVQHHEH